jgi:hypothetical protein
MTESTTVTVGWTCTPARFVSPQSAPTSYSRSARCPTTRRRSSGRCTAGRRCGAATRPARPASVSTVTWWRANPLPGGGSRARTAAAGGSGQDRPAGRAHARASARGRPARANLRPLARARGRSRPGACPRCQGSPEFPKPAHGNSPPRCGAVRRAGGRRAMGCGGASGLERAGSAVFGPARSFSTR